MSTKLAAAMLMAVGLVVCLSVLIPMVGIDNIQAVTMNILSNPLAVLLVVSPPTLILAILASTLLLPGIAALFMAGLAAFPYIIIGSMIIVLPGLGPAVLAIAVLYGLVTLEVPMLVLAIGIILFVLGAAVAINDYNRRTKTVPPH
jgi:hypothetical protein